MSNQHAPTPSLNHVFVAVVDAQKRTAKQERQWVRIIKKSTQLLPEYKRGLVDLITATHPLETEFRKNWELAKSMPVPIENEAEIANLANQIIAIHMGRHAQQCALINQILGARRVGDIALYPAAL